MGVELRRSPYKRNQSHSYTFTHVFELCPTYFASGIVTSSNKPSSLGNDYEATDIETSLILCSYLLYGCYHELRLWPE